MYQPRFEPAETATQSGQHTVHVSLEFDADVFGPLKCLQYFSSIGILPERYSLSRTQDGEGWRVELAVRQGGNHDLSSRALRRVLSMRFNVKSVLTEAG